jgi:hypothetical protein
MDVGRANGQAKSSGLSVPQGQTANRLTHATHSGGDTIQAINSYIAQSNGELRIMLLVEVSVLLVILR